VPVEALGTQSARHDSGAVVRSAGRDAIKVDYAGRTVTLETEGGIGVEYFYLPAEMRWDDGTSIPLDTVDLLKRAVSDVERFWGARAVLKKVGE
jgi:hypothetical protein